MTTYDNSWRVTALFCAETSPGKYMVITFIFSLVFKCGFCLERNDGMVLLLVTILLLIRVAISVFRKGVFSVFSPSRDLEDRNNLHLMMEQFGRLSFP